MNAFLGSVRQNKTELDVEARFVKDCFFESLINLRSVVGMNSLKQL